MAAKVKTVVYTASAVSSLPDPKFCRFREWGFVFIDFRSAYNLHHKQCRFGINRASSWLQLSSISIERVNLSCSTSFVFASVCVYPQVKRTREGLCCCISTRAS